MKILLGLHCNDKSHAPLAANLLRTEAHLLAYHIHQPAIDAAGVIAKVHAHEVKTNPDTTVVPFQQTVSEIADGIHKLLLAGNTNAFIDNANAWLDASLTSPLRNMFNGHLIYGISTEQEAQFIRDNNGMLVHIISTDKPRMIEIQQSELATYCVRGEQPQANTLKTIAKCVREHFALIAQAGDKAGDKAEAA